MEAVKFINAELLESSKDKDRNSNDGNRQKPTFEELRESNETTIAFDFDAEDCEYMVITSDKNIKFSKDFLKYVCDDMSSVPKEIDLSEVPVEAVITIFALYLPRTSIDTRSKINILIHFISKIFPVINSVIK